MHRCKFGDLRYGRIPRWQEDGEDGTRSRGSSALHPKCAAVAFDDIVAHPKSQTGTGISFGGDERLENAAPYAVWNAAASISYRHPHSLSPRIVPVDRFA